MSSRIIDALDFAYQAHKGQEREEGVPYIVHPLDVMRQVVQWGITDENLLITCLAHDVIEDCGKSLKEIGTLFGQEVATSVGHLTFRPKVHHENSSDYQEAKSKHLVSFKDKPLDVLVVKLADRIRNTKDFCSSSPDYANRYLSRAIGLFVVFHARKKELLDTYGVEVLNRITVSIIEIEKEAKAAGKV